MRELSLFSGAGGGLLASNMLGWNTVGYVERDDYCQQVIAARIKDGFLDEAPIFSSIESFICEGFAEAYKGMVDVITAGFPCQGWSAIGKHAGEKDPRNKWPETLSAIEIIKPEYVFLENSTNIMSKGFIFQIIQDLSPLGYVGRATRLSGLHTGAYTKRERTWIKAKLPDSARPGLEGRDDFIAEWQAKNRSIPPLGKNYVRLDLPDTRAFRDNSRATSRVDRTKAIGNAQIPSVAATAWQIL